MIELNLLPKELRKRRKKVTKRELSDIKIPVIPIVAGVFVVLVGTHILFSLLLANNNDLQKTLRTKWEELRPQRDRITKVDKEFSSLEKRVFAVRKIARPDLEWSRLLSGLNQAVVQNIWLSGFVLKLGDNVTGGSGGAQPGALLYLTGFALGKSEQATPVVARFINSLKNNEDFSLYFSEIELKNMMRRDVAGEETMMLKLTCKLKKIQSISAAEKK